MKQKKIPMRMCVGCREMKPKKELMRVVRGPDGTVSLDPTGKKPGRGAYVCRSGANSYSGVLVKVRPKVEVETAAGEARS
ncbi:MAG: YlxR family protein, partial [Clostridia bacterium]|nr:YlxR family protein [Clostridia bacterium]